MKRFLLFVLTFGIFCFTACTSSSNEGKTDTKTKKTTAPKAAKDEPVKMLPNGGMSKNGITLTPVTDSPKFEDSKLSLKGLKVGQNLKTGKNVFDFGVENYELGSQTSDAQQKMCANSGKGQHIHFILNNAPYSAHYDAKVEKEMEEGNYVLLAFLSRSYHESLKHKDAAVLTTFSVGNPKEKYDDEAKRKEFFNSPHLFYSRPKGEYVGDDIKHLMLDFYLINTELSPTGNKVAATINGTTFMIDKWQPYFMEGLPEGENTIELKLVDKDGKGIEGPFNTVKRTVKLSKGEPLKG